MDAPEPQRVSMYSTAPVDAWAKPMRHHKCLTAPFQIVLRLSVDKIALIFPSIIESEQMLQNARCTGEYLGKSF